jgi:hypothetical protein
MAGIQVLDPEAESLETLRDGWSFVCARVASDPNAAPFLSAFIAFGPEWDTVKQKENALRDAITKAEATAVSADHVLNGLLELPPEYAESFFRHTPKGKGPKTVQEAAERVGKLEEELEKARRLYADLLAEQETAVDKKQHRERVREAEAEAQKAAKEARAEAKKKIDEAKAKAKAVKAAAKKK